MSLLASLPRNKLHAALGMVAWAAGFLAAALLDGHADPGSLVLPLVLAAALASVWWSTWAAACACVAAVLVFNWVFVTPRGSLHVTFARDSLLLSAMLAVSVGITLLMARQRRLAARERLQAHRVGQLYRISEAVRVAADVQEVCAALESVFSGVGPGHADVVCLARSEQAGESMEMLTGAVSADERGGLELCLRQGVQMGPGTGRYANQPCWYLPLRGLRSVLGAALVRMPLELLESPEVRAHAQAMCDVAGQALEHLHGVSSAARSRRMAQAQAFRSTMLASISHDYRTPLAAILGAASSLREQGGRLSPEQRGRLAASIEEEAHHLSRVTDNALQLARLDAMPQGICRDWESVEELVGAVLRRMRARYPERRIQARLARELPLLRCDAVLVVQMLENLIDNALKYSPATEAVEIVCRSREGGLSIEVRDRGVGFPAELEGCLFEAYERGDDARASGVRGAGIGLALCRAVVRVHGAELAMRSRRQGGTSAEVLFPLEPMPAPVVEEDAP